MYFVKFRSVCLCLIIKIILKSLWTRNVTKLTSDEFHSQISDFEDLGFSAQLQLRSPRQRKGKWTHTDVAQCHNAFTFSNQTRRSCHCRRDIFSFSLAASSGPTNALHNLDKNLKVYSSVCVEYISCIKSICVWFFKKNLTQVVFANLLNVSQRCEMDFKPVCMRAHTNTHTSRAYLHTEIHLFSNEKRCIVKRCI